MDDAYQNCPAFENEKYKLRFVLQEDCLDLLKVYSDKKAVPFFNSDNCGGDDFHYTSAKRMKEAIDFWHSSYSYKTFVRWTILDKDKNEAIGSIELFHRDGNDYFSNCGLLRLDVRSDYEVEGEIENILSLIIESTYTMFDCDKIATKARSSATERIKALRSIGFSETNEHLIGHDGTSYDSYFVLLK